MRLLILLMASVMLAGCPYKVEVGSISDKELCENLGIYTLKEHEEGVRISRNEIERRNLDEAECMSVANEARESFRPEYKKQVCRRAGAYYYEGNYQAFKDVVTKIQSLGFDDRECVATAEFYARHIERDRERRSAIVEAITEASDN